MRSHIRTAEEDSQMETVSGLIEELKSDDCNVRRHAREKIADQLQDG